MGTIILIITFILEAAFAAYCMMTRSPQTRVRSFMRIGAFSAFGLLTLASIIHWGFTWYLFALLLFFWAALGAWALIRRKTSENGYRAWGSAVRVFGTLFLVFITLIPALVFPQAKLPPATGSHPVATASYTYTDPNRTETFSRTGGNREVNVEFWYPAGGGGTYPLIIFSHGTGGTKTSNTSTFLNLASNGYVVCSIDHPYHSLYTVDADGRRTTIDPAYLQDYLAASSGKYDDVTELKLEQGWMKLRTDDINFTLDTILQKTNETGSGAVYQVIDPSRIGLMGHSLGGESSAAVARQRAENGKNDIAAVINLDADLAGEYTGFQEGQEVINTQPYPVPILNIFSDVLENLMNKVPNPSETLAVKHLVATNNNAYEIHLAGTDHMSFTDLPLISPFLVSMINRSVPKAGGVEADPYATVEKMNGIVLQFFNVYLKGEGSFTKVGSN